MRMDDRKIILWWSIWIDWLMKVGFSDKNMLWYIEKHWFLKIDSYCRWKWCRIYSESGWWWWWWWWWKWLMTVGAFKFTFCAQSLARQLIHLKLFQICTTHTWMFHKAPEKWWLNNEIPLWDGWYLFSGLMLHFVGGKSHCLFGECRSQLMGRSNKTWRQRPGRIKLRGLV